MAKIKGIDEEWSAIIADQEASGLNHIKWCELHGIDVYTFRQQLCNKIKLDIKNKAKESTSQTKGISDDVAHDKKDTQSKQNDNSNETTWIEIHTKENETHDKINPTGQIGKLTIEARGVRITADASYPVTLIAALIREADLC